jgi:hypothetical protein
MTPDRGEEVLRAGRASTMIAEQFSKTPVRSVGAVTRGAAWSQWF